MADIQKALRQTLVATSGVTAELASTSAVYYDNLPQNADLPALVLTTVSGEQERTLSGASSIMRSRIQVDAFADKRVTANTVSDAVATALDDFDAGTIGSGANAVAVRQIYCDPPQDEIDAPVDGTQQFRHVRTRDVIVWH